MADHGLETGFVSDVLLPLALAIIMFGMGMSLTGRDFTRVARIPRGFFTGLAGQIFALPLIAMLVAVVFNHAFGLSATLVLGLLLLACVPGGATSNLLTFLGRGDIALSVTLTSIVTLGGVVLVPLLYQGMTTILFAEPQIVTVAFLDMALLVLVVLAVPVLLGMLVRRLLPGFAGASERPVRVLSIVIFILVVAGVIWANRADFWTNAGRSVPAALTLNVLALGAGLLLGRLGRVPTTQRRALAFEVGFQNGTLGITLAVTQLGSTQAALMPAFYGLVMFLTGGALAWWWNRSPPDTMAPLPTPTAAPAATTGLPLVIMDDPAPGPEEDTTPA